MNPLSIAATFALTVLAVIVVFLVVTTYNSIVGLIQRIDKAWANIDVSLRQRHDELPNLVSAVRGIMSLEQTVFEEVARRRAEYRPTAPIPDQAATSEATSAAVRSLFAVVERYPALLSQHNVAALQAEIARLEGIIADRRELYNDSVYLYNTRIAQVPAVLVAWLFAWKPRPLFTAEPGDTVRPDVDLRFH